MADTAIALRDDRVLAKLETARLALSQAKTIQDAKHIMDVAAAAEIYAKRQQLGDEAIGFAHEIKIEALRRLGEMLQATERNTGGAKEFRAVPGEDRSARCLNCRAIYKLADGHICQQAPPTLADLGLDKKTSSIAQKLAELPAEQFDQVRMGTSSVAKAIREVQHAKRPSVALPVTDTYRVIYADPPWSYGNSGVINEDNYGRAARHYPSMTIEELCALPVAELADPDAVLFLWVTSPLLRECFAVIEAWGFTYKSSFVWDKVKHNFGHYNSVRHEFLLICTRGSCTPDVATLHDSVQSIERTAKHSEKPEAFRDLIDAMYPRGARMELFARTPHEKWATWGNESGSARAL